MPVSSEIVSAFNDYFHVVVEDLLSSNNGNGDISWSFKRIKDIVEYNVPDGKRTRGLTVVGTYLALNKDATHEQRNILLALGWAVEILQASFLVADDLMDQSEMRRNRECWYRKPGIGYQAINDSMVLESCVFTVLRNTCRHLPCYADLVDLFHRVILNTEMGQSLDMMTSELPEVNFSLFTLERYSDIVKYKTGYYSFYLPVAVALYLAGVSCDAKHNNACQLLLKIGNLFQIQDDFLDCFGDPKMTGKIGTDIEDNKCSWLIIQAINLASDEQIKELEGNYGQKDAAKSQVVKNIFKQLNLDVVFEKFENEQYETICGDIAQYDDPEIPKSIFLDLLNKIYGRKK